MTTLMAPTQAELPSFIAALERGWSPDTTRGADAATEELARLRADPARYLALMTDREAAGGPVKLPDGSMVQRLPGLRRWIWDGEFCGSIGLRWQRGTPELPSHTLGHIGYAVVPWKRQRGHATRALGLMLAIARDEGLPWVTITTDADNAVSQRVIEANGGELVERFTKPAAFGGLPGLRYRVMLAGSHGSP